MNASVRWILPNLALALVSTMALALPGFTLFSATQPLSVSSGNIAINPAGTLLAVANPDSNSVTFVSLTDDRVVAEVAVGIDPRCVAWLPDGRYLLVTNQGSNSVSAIRSSDFAVAKTIPVDPAPYGIVVRHQDGRVFVSAGAADTVNVIDLNPRPLTGTSIAQRLTQALFARLGRIDNARTVARVTTTPQPRGLALSASGASLYVTHFLTATISTIDTASLKQTQSISTLADGNMSQKIALHPSNGRAYLPHIRSNTGNRFLLFDTTIFPTLSSIDLTAGVSVTQERVDLSIGPTSVNLPFDMTFSSDGRQAYIVNLGSEDVVELDLATGRRTGTVDVGNGPRGIALHPDGRTLYVSNSLSDDISVISLPALQERKRIRVTVSPLPELIRKGKIAFFSSRSANLSRDRWMSCASCHFEGEHDGRTWAFTAGPRNTTSLLGIADTGPLHWSADRNEVQDFEFTIRTLQAGTGLIKDGEPRVELGPANAGLSSDLDALAAFTNSLKLAPSPLQGSGAAVARGKSVFERQDVGCTDCHTGVNYTDSSLLSTPYRVHDVDTATSPDERLGSAFDTPSLRGVWNTAPYLHDGSAPTLMDVFTGRNERDRHGRTSHLSVQDLQDLVAFLRAL